MREHHYSLARPDSKEINKTFAGEIGKLSRLKICRRKASRFKSGAKDSFKIKQYGKKVSLKAVEQVMEPENSSCIGIIIIIIWIVKTIFE